jgi:beta-galactosidase
MQANGHLQWSIPYSPGKLEAIAYRKGKKITTSVQTTGAPYQVILTPDRTIVHADGLDATVINVTVKDKSGREVPDANSLIQFSIQGDAKIIGAGNGDPSCHEPDQYLNGHYERSLFNGKCQVIVQAGATPGVIVVEAKTTGLQKAVAEIQIVK